MAQLPILGYKRHVKPVLKKSKRIGLPTTPDARYLDDELQRIENALLTQKEAADTTVKDTL